MHRFIASGFGVGVLPRRIWGSDSGAGTVGAVLAGGASWLMWDLSPWFHILAAAVAIGISIWSAAPFSTAGEDPGWIVIDEIAGVLVAVIALRGWAWAVAWLVFRAADITKRPPGVRRAEDLHGALGITADDVVAGLYGLAAGTVVSLL